MSHPTPSKWVMGPPAPRWMAIVARILMLTAIFLVGHWVNAYLGGVAFEPIPDGKGGNDTGRLFNWHPILMTLAFAVFMSEAILAYQSPLLPWLTRPNRKLLHMTLHGLAAICLVVGVTVAFKSHTLKLPVPTPNLYSPHSYLGIGTVSLAAVQVVLALSMYLNPKVTQSDRMALGPIHRFMGMATWLMGLTTMATGFQEKVTFIQMGKGLSGAGLYTGLVRLPAATLLVLALLAMTVLYHLAPPAAGPAPAAPGQSEQSHMEEELLGGDRFGSGNVNRQPSIGSGSV